MSEVFVGVYICASLMINYIREDRRLLLSKIYTWLISKLQCGCFCILRILLKHVYQLVLGRKSCTKLLQDRQSTFQVEEQFTKKFECNVNPGPSIAIEDKKGKVVIGEWSQKSAKGT